MSLPIVIIFERHWDTIPKLLLQDLLPNMVKQGYDTICLEAPQERFSTEIIQNLHSNIEFDADIQQQAEKCLERVKITSKLCDMSFLKLAELMRQYVSSQKYLEVAEKIKQLPAFRILKEVCDEAVKQHVSVKGIDINAADFRAMVAPSLLERRAGIDAREEERIQTLFANLLKLRAEQEEGVVFVCGAFHAAGLLAKFKQQNMHNEVLYYFPHSSSRYDESIDDIRAEMNDTLLGHTHRLAPQEVRPFSEMVLKEIRSKARYTKEVPEGNSHSRLLSALFKANFRAFLRPGYYVDALVDADTSGIEAIQKRISGVGIQTHETLLNQKRFLVVPNINVREIAYKIRAIPA